MGKIRARIVGALTKVHECLRWIGRCPNVFVMKQKLSQRGVVETCRWFDLGVLQTGWCRCCVGIESGLAVTVAGPETVTNHLM